MNIGIFGAGRWGYNLIKNFSLLLGVEKIVVYDPDSLKLLRINFGSHVSCTTRQEEIFECDAIVIATPISTHFELASKAIMAGKNVFIEKPVTATADECLKLTSLAKVGGGVVMVGHIFLYNSAVVKIKELIDLGELGDICHIHSTRLNFGPIRTDVDAVIDIATHDISIVNYLLNSTPEFVSASSGGWVSGKMDTCISTLTYPKNILVSIYSSWFVPEKEQKMVIVGSKKMVVFNNLNVFEPIRIYNKKVIPEYPDENLYIPKLKEEEIIIPKVASEEPLKNECQWFIDCCHGKKNPKSDLEESLRVMKILDAIRTSYAEKRVVTL